MNNLDSPVDQKREDNLTTCQQQLSADSAPIDSTRVDLSKNLEGFQEFCNQVITKNENLINLFNEKYTLYMGTLVPKEKLRDFIDLLFIELIPGAPSSDESNTVTLAPENTDNARYICHPSVNINQELYNTYYRDDPINVFNINKEKLYQAMSLENLDTTNLTMEDVVKLKSLPMVILNNEYCIERIPCGAYEGDFMITLMKLDLNRQVPCAKFYVHDKHILPTINPFIRSLAELGIAGRYKFTIAYSITAEKIKY